VAKAAINGARGRNQGLPQHLTSEYPLRAVLWAHPAKDVFFDLFEIEKLDEIADRRVLSFSHGLK
jgi:hypothetical protein